MHIGQEEGADAAAHLTQSRKDAKEIEGLVIQGLRDLGAGELGELQ